MCVCLCARPCVCLFTGSLDPAEVTDVHGSDKLRHSVQINPLTSVFVYIYSII